MRYERCAALRTLSGDDGAHGSGRDRRLPAIRDGGGWAVVRNQQDETERGIVRHNVSVLKRFADTAALTRLAALAASGDLPTTIAATYAPEQAAEAHRRQAAGGVRGRLLIVS
jgi:hypothetical protein